MLTTLKELLISAEENNNAVLAPDFTTFVAARAMIEQVEEMKAPLILSYSNAFRSITEVTDYPRFIGLVREAIERASVPICLHLDHATTLDEIKEAVDVGFSSVMIDASQEEWEVNIERTRRTIEIARPHGVSVESELGRIGSGEGYITEEKAEAFFTDPQKAKEFAEITGIDALAVSIGNVHGLYQGEPMIDYPRLQALHELVPVPLVLHGTSGIGKENLSRAIQHGIRKINLYSEIVLSMHTEMRNKLTETLFDPVGVVEAQKNGIKKVIRDYVEVTNPVLE